MADSMPDKFVFLNNCGTSKLPIQEIFGFFLKINGLNLVWYSVFYSNIITNITVILYLDVFKFVVT